ncbi:hypothetical protein [Noviherbaspirillum autotrophicum]|uniref:hypothetical protein n=1 Tax=Noviherbaspirillum autotrophicum TaxID=709839 RepID=UPI000B09F252|nr:hypothetical protein [Noviherbaspirillum autotrophicum]
MAKDPKHFMNEADIGSGEKSAGQLDVENDVRSVKGTPLGEPSTTQGGEQAAPGRILRSGTHLARIFAKPQPDGSFEAQVYVRLTREPEVAETYIPAGVYASEAEAWDAAENRAKRAIQEHEF